MSWRAAEDGPALSVLAADSCCNMKLVKGQQPRCHLLSAYLCHPLKQQRLPGLLHLLPSLMLAAPPSAVPLWHTSFSATLFSSLSFSCCHHKDLYVLYCAVSSPCRAQRLSLAPEIKSPLRKGWRFNLKKTPS